MDRIQEMNLSENEVMEMIRDTSAIAAGDRAEKLSNAASAAKLSGSLTNEVEFYQWLDRNFSQSGIFESGDSMRGYIAMGEGKESWFNKQIQGKGYEWDWMSQQRNAPSKILNQYEAGDVSNRVGTDVTERNIFSGKENEYQMKAYTSKTNPELKNTPKDVTVVTNEEKAGIVRQNGYENVEEFQDADAIKNSTQKRMDDIKSGKANTSYTIKNVAGTMAKAGAIGAVIGIGTEAVVSYRAWKDGRISDKEYLSEVLKAGGESGIVGAASAGIMIPVSQAIVAGGFSNLLTIPVAIVVSGVLNEIVAPCFGRGRYRKILNEAQYYQNLSLFYGDLTESMKRYSEEYFDYVVTICNQSEEYNALKEQHAEIDKQLRDLYFSI